MPKQEYKYLYAIDSPADLKTLSTEELSEYVEELRGYIVDELSENPGHLGSSLGVVELTAALHYIYNTPWDKIVWDVGHQAYAHKIITGRRDRFSTNRKLGGLSGFPKMSESEYDSFGAGHSSVSISAAHGISVASALKGEKRSVIAVIGDGALSGGLAFEGLNNAGSRSDDLLVILNDNRISIGDNTGALKDYLFRLSTSRKFHRLKESTWNVLRATPRLRRGVQKISRMFKRSVLEQSNLFESFNFSYFGPIDGHDMKGLLKTLKLLKNIPGPKLLHVMTVKGHGYKYAENDQTVWHAPGRFDPDTGVRKCEIDDSLPSLYQDVFGETLVDLMREDDRVVGVTPAMPKGSSLDIVMEEFPGRCFDVGIAEGHAATFSAGMATEGMIPFCNIYSSFAQRAYDNVIHDIALQRLGVVLCLDRAGLVGEDGSTHHGVFDLAFFIPIPQMVIASPMNERELRDMLYTAKQSGSPFVVRYPRGRGVGVEWCGKEFRELEIGESRLVSEGTDIALLTLGPLGNEGAEAVTEALKQGVSVQHVDLRYAKPLDYQMLDNVAKRFDRIVTVEDGVRMGGVGESVSSYLTSIGYGGRIKILGIEDDFVEHGSQKELYAVCGIDKQGILKALVEW